MFHLSKDMSAKFLIVYNIVIIFEITDSFRSENVDNKFRRIYTNQRSHTTYIPHTAVSRFNCAALCSQDNTCYGFSHQRSSGTCLLVDGWEALCTTVSATGFSVFQKVFAHDFIQVGDYPIAVYKEGLQKATANIACMPLGRLIRLDTLEKFNTIRDYMKLQQPDVALVDIWTDGYYQTNDSTWRFSDGSPLPVDEDPTIIFSDALEPTCVRLKYRNEDNGYQWRDMKCGKVYSYMCELI